MRRALGWIGCASIALGILYNRWTGALVWPNPVLDEHARRSIWLIQGLCIALGTAVLLGRARLAELFTRGLFSAGDRALRRILGIGIVLRIVVFVFQRPHNNDPHLEVVRYIIENGRLPNSWELPMSFQPPLYYLLAVPWALVGPDKVVQLFSLLLSLGNLALLYLLISRTPLLRSDRARGHAMLFAAILPQFVLFGNFISNDAPSYLLGNLTILQAFRYLENPSRRNLLWLSLLPGIGSLIKGSTLAFLPVLSAVILLSGLRRKAPILRIAGSLALFAAIAITLGSYKFIENKIEIGQFVSDQEVLQRDWIADQSGFYLDPGSLISFNLPKLLRYPVDGEHTNHCLPLILYGTFWYSYIQESDFNETRAQIVSAMPRALYVFGLLPTFLLLAGAWSWIRHRLRLREFLHGTDEQHRVGMQAAVAAVLLLAYLGLVVTWGLKHDAYSFFQARLLFPAFFSIAILLGWGVEATTSRSEPRARTLDLALCTGYGLFFIYFVVEIAGTVVRWVAP